MNWRKEIASEESKSFVRKSIIANFGESKANEVDNVFDDPIQGYDRDKLDQNMDVNDGNSSEFSNRQFSRYDSLGNGKKEQSQGDTDGKFNQNHSEIMNYSGFDNRGNKTVDGSLELSNIQFRGNNQSRRRELEILIQAVPRNSLDMQNRLDISRLSRNESSKSNRDSGMSVLRQLDSRVDTAMILKDLEDHQIDSSDQNINTSKDIDVNGPIMNKNNLAVSEQSHHLNSKEGFSINLKKSPEVDDEDDEDDLGQIPLTPQKLMMMYKKQQSREFEDVQEFKVSSDSSVVDKKARGLSEMVKKLILVIIILSVMEVGKYLYLNDGVQSFNTAIVSV